MQTVYPVLLSCIFLLLFPKGKKITTYFLRTRFLFIKKANQALSQTFSLEGQQSE